MELTESIERKPKAECAGPIPGRRIVSVSVAGVQNNPGTQCNWLTTAVCDDGSIWCIKDNEAEWWELPPIPQTSGTTKDRTAAERQKRYRQRMALRRDTAPLHRDVTVSKRNVTTSATSPAMSVSVAAPAPPAGVEGALGPVATEVQPDPQFHVEPHSGYPQSAILAALHADKVGCPTEFAVKTWQACEQRGGRDEKDMPIRSFRTHLSAAWLDEQARTKIQEADPLKVAEAKLKELRKHHAGQLPDGSWRWDEAKNLAAAQALKAEIAELRKPNERRP